MRLRIQIIKQREIDKLNIIIADFDINGNDKFNLNDNSLKDLGVNVENY